MTTVLNLHSADGKQHYVSYFSGCLINIYKSHKNKCWEAKVFNIKTCEDFFCKNKDQKKLLAQLVQLGCLDGKTFINVFKSIIVRIHSNNRMEYEVSISEAPQKSAAKLITSKRKGSTCKHGKHEEKCPICASWGSSYSGIREHD